MGRPRKYANDAEKQAAYRARYVVFDVRLAADTAGTIDEIAAMYEVPRTEVINAMVNFALLNRNWKTQGLFGKMLPRVDKGKK